MLSGLTRDLFELPNFLFIDWLWFQVFDFENVGSFLPLYGPMLVVIAKQAISSFFLPLIAVYVFDLWTVNQRIQI